MSPRQRLFAAGLALALAATALVGCSLPGGGLAEGYHLTAEFDSAVGLYEAGDVSVMGEAVGVVNEVAIEDDHIRVEMTIDRDVPLPFDVNATIEPLTLIGERNVVLYPPWDEAMAEEGRERAQDGDTIPQERTDVPVEPDEALEAFNDLARSLDPKVVGDLVTDSAEALDGLGDDLGSALDQAAGITTTLAEVDDQLLAAADGLHRIASSLNTREQQLSTLVRQFSDATQVLADERDGIRGFLSALVDVTENGREVLDTYGGQLPDDIAHLTALAMVLNANADAADQLIGSFPRVAEGIARGYQPDIRGIYLRANGTPTLIGLLEVFRDILGVLPPEPAP